MNIDTGLASRRGMRIESSRLCPPSTEDARYPATSTSWFVRALLVGLILSTATTTQIAVAQTPDRSDSLEQIRYVFREYLAAQARHHAARGVYAGSMSRLHRGFFPRDFSERSRGFNSWVVTASSTGHSAVGYTIGRRNLMCGVRQGTAAPPLLDQASGDDMTCRLLKLGPVPPPQPSGVLLGLAGDRGYRTMWIVFGPDSAARLTEGAGVLAPRADGFWRFDVVDDDRGLEMLVAEPASQPSRRDTVVRFGARVPTDPRNRSLTIEFVGPRHLGYIKEAFFPGENREYRERYAPDQRGVLGPDLSPVQTDAFLGAAAEVLAVEASGYEGCGGHPVWTVVRDAQRWVFAGFHNSVDTFGRGCDAADADISTYVEPSRNVIDYSPVFILLVRFVVPSAVDAVLSPNRDAVVALTPDSIYAFTVSPTAFGTPRAVAAESGRVVMAEWALGRHVARWTGEVRKWLTR